MSVKQFNINVPDEVLTALVGRLATTRWPQEIPGAGWAYGTNLDYIKGLVEYWRTQYDWRERERELNQMPQFIANVDGLDLHFVHQVGKGPDPFPIIFMHGWPGSFFEVYKIIGPLTDPASHGGDPKDSFDVVAPSLPGYGFSGRPREPGVNPGRVADYFAKLMTGPLGYTRFGAQGGDWGAIIATRLGAEHADAVVGIHLNMVAGAVAPTAGDMTTAERSWREEQAAYHAEELGYARIQSTKPQTLAYALNDSPTGLCAWIVEKFRRWSDCDGEVERRFTRDELLTNVMLYWVTQSIGSSMRLYYESFHEERDAPQRVEVPTGVAAFPKEILRPPREAAERSYNITRWTEMPAGGHFAALEEPAALVADIRDFFRPLRG